MDDGCKSEPGFVLCTEGSASPSKLYLVQTLKEKFAEPQKSRAGGVATPPPVVLGGDPPVDEIYGPACNPAVAGAPTLRRGGPGAWLRGAAGFT